MNWKWLSIILTGVFVVASLVYVNNLVPKPNANACTENNCPDGTGGQAQEWSNIPDGYNGTFLMHIGGGNQENPSCPSQIVNNMSSYQGGFDMFTKNTSRTIKVKIFSQSYYCSEPNQMSTDHANKCIVNPQASQSFTVSLAPGQYYTWRPNAVSTNSCGFAQWDMSFQVLDANNNAVYTVGDINNPGIGGQAYWSYCYAGINGNKNWCPTVTPTATPTSTPTPTVTNTPTPTVTITPTETPTPTPTETPTPTGTLTPTPTGTLTPTPTNTPTPTPTPGPTVTPTMPPPPNAPRLPKTGGEAEIVFGFISLIGAGWKMRKFR